MRTILILFSFIIANQAFGQKGLFDTLKIDATTKIIGRYPQYDKNKTYENYNFIIEEPVEIEKFVKKIKLDEEVPNSIEDPNFVITIIKNYQETGSWTINPRQQSAMTHDGHTYKFNLNQIIELHKQYPFKYNSEKKMFKSKLDFETYLAEQKNNPNFLSAYAPQFRYEGSFEIEFKKSSQFPHPKAISDYILPYIEKIVDKGEYSVTYILNDKNMNNNDQYTMTVSGPKKLFDELKIIGLKNENWHAIVESAFFFYKK